MAVDTGRSCSSRVCAGRMRSVLGGEVAVPRCCTWTQVLEDGEVVGHARCRAGFMAATMRLTCLESMAGGGHLPLVSGLWRNRDGTPAAQRRPGARQVPSVET